MYCRNCGYENEDGARFCGKCGASLMEEPSVTNNTGYAESTPAPNPNDKKDKTYIALIAGVSVLIVILVAALIFVLVKISKGAAAAENNSETVETEQQQEEDTSRELSTGDDSRQLIVSTDAKYSFNSLAVLDLSLRNYTPNQKQQGMDWDSTLFYTLEDVYADSTADNQIANYQIVNYEFTNAQTQNIIRCVVYKNPDNSQIAKIVTIEKQNGVYLVSDYYYDNGKVNFVFTRTVDVYTPTYATIDKVGNRYYFNHDVLVRYRKIDVPKQIEQQTLNPSTTWYPNRSYFELSSEEMAAYDAVEMQVLNEAYNVLNAVQGEDSLFEMKGYVYGAGNVPVSNASVAVIASADDTVLYTTTTGNDGAYHLYTLLDGTDCYVQVYAEGYVPAYVYDVRLDETLSGNGFSYLYLAKEGAGETEVQFYLYNAVDLTVGADTAQLSSGQVTIRSGWNVKNGGSVTEGTMDGNTYTAQLQPGAYTAEFRLDGYMTTYENFAVTGEGCVVKGYTVPAITDNSEKAVLCWDSDIDLDMVLYTPERSAYGDMNYISARQSLDDYQDFLIADGTDTRCEVMNIGNQLIGTYKLYVNDYTSFVNGTYDSDALANSHARIYIYSKEGLVAVYYVDFSQPGVVWSVCERGNSGYHPSSIVSSNVNGYVALDKTRMTKDERLEMYKEFLRGNITAEYEGSQVDYDTLVRTFADDFQREYEEILGAFTLTDIDFDDMPELQIYFRNTSAYVLYKVSVVNDKLTIFARKDSDWSYEDLTLYKSGMSYSVEGMRQWAYLSWFNDAADNTIAEFDYFYDGATDNIEDVVEAVQEQFNDLTQNEGYKYVYVSHGEEREGEAWDKFEAVVNQFKADYCGEEATFYDVNEDSLQQNMRWE